MDDINPQFELNKQLHEQYATNVNANTGTFISFITALLVLFGFFGYVYIFSNVKFEDFYSTTRLPIDAFYAISIVTSGILFFLSVMASHLGYSQRRDQIVIDNIRNIYYIGNNSVNKKAEKSEPKNESMKDRIFGDSYNPKDKNWCSFIPDYFNYFWWLFIVSQVFAISLVAIKLCAIKLCAIKLCAIKHMLYILIVQVILLLLSLYCRYCMYKKYKKQIDSEAFNKQSCFKKLFCKLPQSNNNC